MKPIDWKLTVLKLPFACQYAYVKGCSDVGSQNLDSACPAYSVGYSV